MSSNGPMPPGIPGVVLPPNVHETRTLEAIASMTPFAALAILAVALRFYSRRLIKTYYGLDDQLCLVALIFSLGIYANALMMVYYGSGRHLAVVSIFDRTAYFKCLFAFQIGYAHAIFFNKISMLNLYTRIFSTKSYKISAWVVEGMVFAWYIAVVGVSIFSCYPIQGFWNKAMVPPAKCIRTKLFFVGNAMPNLATDMIILILPIRGIWALRLTISQRISLSFLFLLGSLIPVASAVRFAAQFGVDKTDFTWTMHDTVIWTSLQTSIGIICACLPTLRPLLQKFLTNSKRRGSEQHHEMSKGSGTFGPFFKDPFEMVTIICADDSEAAPLAPPGRIRAETQVEVVYSSKDNI
ncbi:hypothetical protein EJ05DRAFT_498347 [Pseudovirgaria hyperparasitica]|uniref:Rhodopsin domain-containing protein n=1 Tax=Pseudovirgaria hyperparasitica TaxID=470096 RepID=A0A6A6WDY3_9PEZI|nr:uncharacterized protein EJ05DRAFT_498347 [Pseudovirgaria hyperparasitica]KAF2760389.1 hypothetical protein EJ05DRAFT_498347 [Pseudovirgaria hyperparasitica]